MRKYEIQREKKKWKKGIVLIGEEDYYCLLNQLNSICSK